MLGIYEVDRVNGKSVQVTKTMCACWDQLRTLTQPDRPRWLFDYVLQQSSSESPLEPIAVWCGRMGSVPLASVCRTCNLRRSRAIETDRRYKSWSRRQQWENQTATECAAILLFYTSMFQWIWFESGRLNLLPLEKWSLFCIAMRFVSKRSLFSSSFVSLLSSLLSCAGCLHVPNKELIWREMHSQRVFDSVNAYIHVDNRGALACHAVNHMACCCINCNKYMFIKCFFNEVYSVQAKDLYQWNTSSL